MDNFNSRVKDKKKKTSPDTNENNLRQAYCKLKSNKFLSRPSYFL